MLHTAHVTATLVNGVPVAMLTTEKLGEYESHAVELDLTKLGDEHRWRFAVDFQQVRLLSSVGIGVLIKLQQLARKGSGKVVYFGMDENLTKLIHMTRLDKGMLLAKDRDGAIKVLQ